MKKVSNQSGRSMIEMLGVLAIVGVLSVGGIAGYSKAMGKWRVSKMNEQISMTVASIRTAFGTTKSYSGFDKTVACKMGLFPSEMLPKGNTTCTAATRISNVYGGNVEIGIISNNRGFILAMNRLPEDACISILTSNWGGSTSSGFLGIEQYSGTYTEDMSGIFAYTNPPDSSSASGGVDGDGDSWGFNSWIPADLPLSPVTAQSFCPRGTTGIFLWYFS